MKRNAGGSGDRGIEKALVLGLLCLFGSSIPRSLRSSPLQCPDGTPPPCPGQRVASAVPSLAVMPFETVGGDTANVYFAQGLSDELTTALAHVDRLRVIAAGASFGPGGGRALRAGRALGATVVLEGRVRRSGDRIRIVTQLTSARSGVMMWSNSYEREVRDVFAVQEEVARDIVAAIDAVVHGGRPVAASRPAAPPPVAARPGTGNLEAYDQYLRGRYFLARRDDGVGRSIPYFQRAVALDPGFARAWANLATAWLLLPGWSRVPIDSALTEARAAIATALRLDANSAEAHTAAGFAAGFASDWPRFEGELRRAIALDSTLPDPHTPLTSALLGMGRVDEAVAQGYRALGKDPASSLTASVLSYALVCARRFEEAAALARRGVEMDSTSRLAWGAFALAEFFAGRRDMARAAAARYPMVGASTASLTFVRSALGGRDTAVLLVSQLERRIRDSRASHAATPLAWLAVGDTARALDALERMALVRAPVAFGFAFLSHPAYDLVRNSPRFAAAVRAYGLDPNAFIRAPR